MSTTMTFRSIALITLLGATLAMPVSAQPGPGMGAGAGMQNAGPESGMGADHHGGRGMRCNKDNTRGWKLMTPEERTAHQAKMRSVKTYDECQAVQAEHRAAMETRAKEKGVTLPTPRQNGCDNMKKRGLIK